MKSRPLALIAMLLFALLLSPAATLLAQDDEADIEVLDPAFSDTDTAAAPLATGAEPAQTGWPVCQYGHWIRSGRGYPPVCTRQHIDALQGPLAPCSIITIGGVKYHIVRVVRTTRGWIITVRRI